MAIEKQQLKVVLDIEEIQYIKKVLKQEGMTWTQFIRTIFRLPSENPKPCQIKLPYGSIEELIKEIHGE